MNRVKLFMLLFCLVSIASGDLHAQSKKKSSTKKSTVTEKKSTVIVFGEDEEENIEIKKDKKSNYHDIIIKTSPVSFIFGQQMLEVEKEITSVLSLQVGAGATFKNVLSLDNDILNIFANIGFYENYETSSNFEEGQDIYDDNYSDKTVVPGILLSLSSRFFVDGGGFEDSYIAPTFTFKTVNNNTPAIFPNQSFVEYDQDNFDKEVKKISNFSVRYGNQSISGSNITFEWFIGLGLSFLSDNRQDLGYRNNIVVREFQTTKSTRFLYEAGVRIGYYF